MVSQILYDINYLSDSIFWIFRKLLSKNTILKNESSMKIFIRYRIDMTLLIKSYILMINMN